MIASAMIWVYGAAAVCVAGLIYLAWLVRGQRDQQSDWDAARAGLFLQAEEIQVKAAQTGRDLDEKYRQAAEPYIGLYRRAKAALEQAHASAGRVLQDRARARVQDLPQCQWWGVFTVTPLLGEYRQRQEWQRQTEQLPAELQAGQRSFEQVAQVQQEILDLGRRIKRSIQELIERAAALHVQAITEARPANLLEDELARLDQASGQLQPALDDLLADDTPTAINIMAAHAIYLQTQEAITAVSSCLEALAAKRQSARQALIKLDGQLQALTNEWQAEEQAGRPVNTLSLLLEAFQLRRNRSDQAVDAGDYDQALEESRELAAQIAEQQTSLRQVVTERRRLLNACESASAAIHDLPEQMGAAPDFYELDLMRPLYEKLAARLPELQALAHSENLAELKGVETPNQAEVLANWQKFVVNQQAFEDRYQALDDRSETVLPRAEQVLENMADRHARYLAGLSLEALNRNQDGLLATWQAVDDAIRPGIRESALPDLIEQLGSIEQAASRLEKACDQAERKFALLSKEREQARLEVEHGDWPALTRQLELIAAQGDAELAGSGAVCLENWRKQRQSFEQPGADFAELTRQVNQLRSEAEKLDKKYRTLLVKAGDQQRKLTDELNRLQSDLRAIQSASGPGVSNLEGQAIEIETWLKQATDLPKEALKALNSHNQAGVNLRAIARQARDQAVARRKRYEDALQQAQLSIEEAREALNAARQLVQNTTWSNRTINQNQLWQGQDQLNRAEKQYKRFTSSPQEYTLERAIQELEENICAPAAKAKRQTDEVSARLRNQTSALQQLRKELDQALQRGNSLRSEMDSQTRNRWQTVQWDLSELENRVQSATNYEEAHRFLTDAVQQVLKVLAGLESQVYAR